MGLVAGGEYQSHQGHVGPRHAATDEHSEVILSGSLAPNIWAVESTSRNVLGSP